MGGLYGGGEEKNGSQGQNWNHGQNWPSASGANNPSGGGAMPNLGSGGNNQQTGPKNNNQNVIGVGGGGNSGSGGVTGNSNNSNNQNSGSGNQSGDGNPGQNQPNSQNWNQQNVQQQQNNDGDQSGAGQQENASNAVGGNPAEAKKLDAKLSSLRESLFSVDGWGGNFVNQTTAWDLPKSPQFNKRTNSASNDGDDPLTGGGASGDPMSSGDNSKFNNFCWTKVNMGTELWEANLRSGGQLGGAATGGPGIGSGVGGGNGGPNDKQKKPAPYLPMTNLGGIWGENDAEHEMEMEFNNMEQQRGGGSVSGHAGGNAGSGGGGIHQNVNAMNFNSQQTAAAAAQQQEDDDENLFMRNKKRNNDNFDNYHDFLGGSAGGGVGGSSVSGGNGGGIQQSGIPSSGVNSGSDVIRGNPRGISGRLNGNPEIWNQNQPNFNNQNPTNLFQNNQQQQQQQQQQNFNQQNKNVFQQQQQQQNQNPNFMNFGGAGGGGVNSLNDQKMDGNFQGMQNQNANNFGGVAGGQQANQQQLLKSQRSVPGNVGNNGNGGNGGVGGGGFNNTFADELDTSIWGNFNNPQQNSQQLNQSNFGGSGAAGAQLRGGVNAQNQLNQQKRGSGNGSNWLESVNNPNQIGSGTSGWSKFSDKSGGTSPWSSTAPPSFPPQQQQQQQQNQQSKNAPFLPFPDGGGGGGANLQNNPNRYLNSNNDLLFSGSQNNPGGNGGGILDGRNPMQNLNKGLNKIDDFSDFGGVGSGVPDDFLMYNQNQNNPQQNIGGGGGQFQSNNPNFNLQNFGNNKNQTAGLHGFGQGGVNDFGSGGGDNLGLGQSRLMLDRSLSGSGAGVGMNVLPGNGPPPQSHMSMHSQQQQQQQLNQMQRNNNFGGGNGGGGGVGGVGIGSGNNFNQQNFGGHTGGQNPIVGDGVGAAAGGGGNNSYPSQPSATQLRMLVQHITMAVQAGYLNHQILNQPLAPQTLILLNQLLQQIKQLQLTQTNLNRMGTSSNNANALQLTIQASKLKQQISNLQQQISSQQAIYINKKQSVNDIMPNFNDMSIKDNFSSSTQSRLNQWKPSIGSAQNDALNPNNLQSTNTLINLGGDNFSRAPGTISKATTSTSAAGGNIQPDGRWNQVRDVGGWPSVEAEADAGFSDLVPEFEPGKPWKGSQIKTIEDDPSLTPGSMARSPLSIRPTATTELFSSNSSKNSPNQEFGLSSNTWSFNINKELPLSAKQVSGGTNEIWGGPPVVAPSIHSVDSSKAGPRGPPPGLGGNNRNMGNLSNFVGIWNSTWLLLKNLTTQIDGSTLRTLCMQHGPLQNFHLYLNHGIALCKYSTREEAQKAQVALNNCVLGNTTICCESPHDSEVNNILQHLGIPSTNNTVTSPNVSIAPQAWRPPSQQVPSSNMVRTNVSDAWGASSVSSGTWPTSTTSSTSATNNMEANENSFLPENLLQSDI